MASRPVIGTFRPMKVASAKQVADTREVAVVHEPG